MTIGGLQAFLRSLAAMLAADHEPRLTDQLETLCGGLEPFKDLSLDDFARLLQETAAQRTAAAPAPSEGPSPAPQAGARSRLKSQEDRAAVDEAAAALQHLYDRATDPALSHEVIRQEVEQIAAAFDIGGLKAVARAFGIRSGLTGKGAAKAKILSRIAERKGRHQRGEAIAEVARMSAPPPAAAPDPPPIEAEVINEERP